MNFYVSLTIHHILCRTQQRGKVCGLPKALRAAYHIRSRAGMKIHLRKNKADAGRIRIPANIENKEGAYTE